MSPRDVAQHLCVSFDDFAELAVRGEGSNNWDGLRGDLLAWISDVETDVVFDGLLHVLETKTRYQYQWLAGDLLLRGLIPCPLTLADFIMRVAPHLNTSVDTIPKYLAATFGDQVTSTTLRELRTSENAAGCVAAIDSMRYGLGEHPA